MFHCTWRGIVDCKAPCNMKPEESASQKLCFCAVSRSHERLRGTSTAITHPELAEEMEDLKHHR